MAGHRAPLVTELVSPASWSVLGFRAFVLIAVGVPWLSFALNAVALAIYTIDLPFMDDWRAFSNGRLGSFDLAYLFQPANDTLYPVGKFLDSMFALLLNSNVVVYQLLSLLAVLGLILYLQQVLLFRLIDDRMIAAAAFFTTVLMLQPGSYWGAQYLAYHQGLPVVAILAILLLALKPQSWKRDLALLAFALLAGLSYISGAFAALGVAVVLSAHAFVPSPRRQDLLRAGIIVGTISLVTCIAQARVIIVSQGGKVHRPDAPWTPPTDTDFWFYVLGKCGRAFALPPHQPATSLAITLLVLLIGIISAVYLLSPVWLRQKRAAEQNHAKWYRSQAFSVVLLGIAAAVSIYLVEVGSGRAGLRPEQIHTDLEIFAFGFRRFHFFWVTILTPWIAATALLALRKLIGNGWSLNLASGGLVALVGGLSLAQGGFAHASYYQQRGRAMTEGLRCMQMQIREGRSEINCPTVNPGDLMNGYLHGLRIGASFVRYLPDPGSLPFLAKEDAVLFRLAKNGATEDARLHNASKVDGPTLSIATQNDPSLFVSLDPARLRSCRQLQVVVDQEVERAGYIEVFYRTSSANKNRQKRSAKVAQTPGAPEKSIVISSSEGFAPELRIDPVADAQKIVVKDIRVGCLRYD